MNSDCQNVKPSLLSLLPSYRHLRPGADGRLGISHVVAKSAGIESQIPKGQSRAMGVLQPTACFSPLLVASLFHLTEGANESAGIELPL